MARRNGNRLQISLIALFLLFEQLCLVAADKVDRAGSRSSETDPQPSSAMDRILAINTRVRENVNSSENVKRTAIEDQIIKANDAQGTSGDLLEGDVILDPDAIPEDKDIYDLQQSKKKTFVQDAQKRQGTRNLKWLWLTKKVPYEISQSLAPVRYKILAAINTFNSKTCVKFVPRKSSDKNYVLFDKRQGCYSRIGRSYNRLGPQIISIGQYCDHEDLIIHEMLHAVGFFHEQSRPDRQTHIKIHWQNVRPGFQNEFIKYNHGQLDSMNFHYNYDSLMHYGSHAFSRSPSLKTITAVGTKDKVQLGNTRMSNLDIIELDALYRCSSKKLNQWTPWSSFSPCDKHCYRNRQRFCYGQTVKSCGGNPNVYGIENQYLKCPKTECPIPIEGNWGEWSPWSECSRSCDEGKKIRKRNCDNPEPANKGHTCKGSSKHEKICQQPRCHLDYDDTDFRNGRLGVWQNDIYDTPGLNWVVHKGDTRTEGTGPHSDHTTKKDYYLYVDSRARREGDNARLVSKELPQTSPNKKCLRFFYHMFGRTMGSLSVYLVPSGQTKKFLFTKTGSQKDDWKLAELNLNVDKPYQLVFDAVIGKGPYSDIAVDDVYIDDGSCDCKDKYKLCGFWQKNRYCKKAFKFMYSACTKSCNFCDCEDDPRCKDWSIKECKKNPVWMEAYCPVTCQACGCYDKNIWCTFWKGLGECQRNPSFMNKNCPKACGLCT